MHILSYILYSGEFVYYLFELKTNILEFQDDRSWFGRLIPMASGCKTANYQDTFELKIHKNQVKVVRLTKSCSYGLILWTYSFGEDCMNDETLNRYKVKWNPQIEGSIKDTGMARTGIWFLVLLLYKNTGQYLPKQEHLTKT